MADYTKISVPIGISTSIWGVRSVLLMTLRNT